MGLCGSSMSAEDAAEKGNDKKVDQVLREQQAADARVNKLLLLGAGASGKSTLFKQMINIYGKGFPEAERKTYTNIIYNNVLTAMKTLCLHSSRFGEVSPDLAEGKALIESDLKEDQPVDEVLGAHIKSLWLDPTIQECYAHQAEFQLNDSAKYFFDQIDTIATMGYIPSEQDVLHARAPTTGIVENHFEIDGNAFKMFDVGGQRNERKKWIHCFENVTAVLFVAALSEYNQVLYEDECQNRMVESLQLFDEIVNSKYFKETSMILFLNKRDVFAEKIEQHPLADWFPEFAGVGSNTFEAAAGWIKEQFEIRNLDPASKTIYTHVTCATDTNNVTAVFSAVKDIILRKNLGKVGLL